MKPTNLRLAFVVAAVLASAFAASAANPTPLIPGSGWQTFDWDNPGSVAVATFSLDLRGATGLTQLTILDAFAGGDMFKVVIAYGNTSVPLFTSHVPLTTLPEENNGEYYPALVWDDIDAAYRLERYYSRLSLALPAGVKYTITIYLTQSALDPTAQPDIPTPITSGLAYIRAGANCGSCSSSSALSLQLSSGVSALAFQSSAVRPRRNWNGGRAGAR
jgi:hypothetical protein